MSYPPPGYGPQPGGWIPPAPPNYGPGQSQPLPGLASYGKRVVAHIIDNLMVMILVGVAILVLVNGPTEIVTCDLDASGEPTFFDDEAVDKGLCEQPTPGTWAAAAFVGVLAVIAWFLYHAWEGATGKTFGKLAMGIRLADRTTMEPIGGWKGIGRGALEMALTYATCGIGGFVDLLFPLWDDDNQTLHDKALSSVVVDAAYLRPKGSALASVGGAWSAPLPTSFPPAYTPPPPPSPGWSPPTSPPVAPPAPPPPPPPPGQGGQPGSPTDPYGRPPADPFA